MRQLCDFIRYLHQVDPEKLLCSCIAHNNFSVSVDDKIQLLDDGFIITESPKQNDVMANS